MLNILEVKEMPYNYAKLLGRIVEKFGTQMRFADAMQMSERSVSLKMNGLRPWKQTQIAKACSLLDIPEEEIGAYFFAI
jgi:hypothetical protein